jgi:ZIP family zinc transporter
MTSVDPSQIVWFGFLASLGTGVVTGVGALPLLFFPGGISSRAEDVFRGFAAGVMLAASFFSLIVPGLEAARARGSGAQSAAAVVIAALLIGALCLWWLHDHAPHEHFIAGREGDLELAARLRRVWLFVIAITLHNVPEGLAVGVGFGGGDIANGMKVATGIGLQNMPEGLAVAASLAGGLGYSRWKAALAALATGLVEPVAGLAGAAIVSVAQSLLPWGLGFAAGAMLFVVSREIIPETHRKGYENEATAGLMIGLAVMIFLDVTLS